MRLGLGSLLDHGLQEGRDEGASLVALRAGFWDDRLLLVCFLLD